MEQKPGYRPAVLEAENAFATKATKELNQLRFELEQVFTTPDVLRQQLQRLYEIICTLSEYERFSPITPTLVLDADKALLAVWDNLLLVIKKLSARPNGLFLTSRFILFVLQAFACQQSLQLDAPDTPSGRTRVELQIDYVHHLDECLLSCLRRIWNESNKSEYFRWATTHLEKVRSDYNQAAMVALSPKELWEVPGMTGAVPWVPAPGDPPVYERFPHATMSASGDEDETGQRPIIRQRLYSDGPLTWPDLTICLIGEDDEGSWLHRPSLRRSWQFVLDVRQYLHYSVVRIRNQLATHAMNHAGMPPELQLYVTRDLETPEKHPYLSRFDFASAYGPFPPKEDQKQACSVCDALTSPEAGADKNKKETCIKNSTTIWNLGLRAFHTFHETLTPTGYKPVMCRFEGPCEGHHEQDDWALRSDAAIINHTRDIVKQRCGQTVTMAKVGLGPTWNLEDTMDCPLKRQRSKFGLEDGAFEMVQDIQGGMHGLLPTMLHRDSKRNACKWEPSQHKECFTVKIDNDKWMLGRSLAAERRIGEALKMIHRSGSCYYPQWCLAIVGQMSDEDAPAEVVWDDSVVVAWDSEGYRARDFENEPFFDIDAFEEEQYFDDDEEFWDHEEF